MASRSFGLSWARKSPSFQTEELGIRSAKQKARAIPNNDASGGISNFDYIGVKHGFLSREWGDEWRLLFSAGPDMAGQASTSDAGKQSQ